MLLGTYSTNFRKNTLSTHDDGGPVLLQNICDLEPTVHVVRLQKTASIDLFLQPTLFGVYEVVINRIILYWT
jgi:hypothetical protein